MSSIERIDETVKNIFNYKSQIKKTWVSTEFRNHMQEVIKNFVEKLEDDFDFVEALVVFYDFIKFINIWIRENSFSLDEIESILDMLKNFNEVLWLVDFDQDLQTEIPEEIQKKLDERTKAKKEKNFDLADKLRAEIESSWFIIIDDRNWSRVEKK